jgi:regulator of sigma E protease
MSTIEAYLQINKDKPLNIGLLRDGSMHFVLVKPTKVDDMWYLGVLPDVPFEKARLSLGQVVSNATSDCVDATGMLIKDLRQLLTGQVSVKELSGPIGIAQMAGIVTEMNNWFAKFTLASALSINLAVFNLLPFPILDGGLIAMLLIESIRRKDISIVAKKWAYNFAFVALVCFFVFVMFNDVSKLGIFAAGR